MRQPGISQQTGSALIVALFLVIVVAGLGAFAVQLQNKQQHGATLQVREYVADQAALAGIEYWSYQIAENGVSACNSTPGSDQTLNLDSHPGFTGFSVITNCTRVDNGVGTRIFVVKADASAGAFGTPDFVRRSITRYVQDSPPVYP